jgi:two-component system sensor histidine kinase BarA
MGGGRVYFQERPGLCGMSYQSVKRLLGETSLERKCRLLFGMCLFVLVFAAFWWVDSIAEKLIKKAAAEKGRDFVDSALLLGHWVIWETDPANKGLVREAARDLQNQRYSYQVMALEDPRAGLIGDVRDGGDLEPGGELLRIRLPENEWEYKTLRKLKDQWSQQLAQELATPPTSADGKPGESTVPTATPSEHPIAITPKYDHDRRWEDGEYRYYYYQPVYWKNSCSRCHRGLSGVDAVAAAEAAAIFDQGMPPFRVVRVIMPDGETRQAIHYTRAILATTAIATVFLSMVGLYLVVKYVIVKPLKHLGYVSDEISRGNTTLRADIHTNDEFETLAASFNRMLVHLVDTQDQLRKANVELDRKLDELAQVNMQLYEMNRLKSDFLANMSHELRTPLNSIIGFSEVLKGIDALDEKQKRYVQNIQKSGRVLLDMINDILDLAKMESGRMEVRPGEFRIGAVVGAQCDMVRSLTEEKNIDLDVRIEPNLPAMYQDQGKVLQILTNLLSNAIKFTPEGGRITVSVRRNEQGVLELTVADTGVGIAEEDRDVIFEKFRQGGAIKGADNLTREFSGTGLGLSIVRELCRLLGGEVTFKSDLGKGSAFTVRIPWNRADEPRRDAALAARLDELARARAGESGRAHDSGESPLSLPAPQGFAGHGRALPGRLPLTARGAAQVARRARRVVLSNRPATTEGLRPRRCVHRTTARPTTAWSPRGTWHDSARPGGRPVHRACPSSCGCCARVRRAAKSALPPARPARRASAAARAATGRLDRGSSTSP